MNHSYEQTVGHSETAENSVTSSTSTSTQEAPESHPLPLVVPSSSSNNTSSVDHVLQTPAEVNQTGQRQAVRRVARYQAVQQDSAPVMHNYNGTIVPIAI